MASTIKMLRGTPVVLAVTALQSLASSATAGWKSVAVDNTSTLATDYEIFCKITTANTAPANDKAVYVYVCPAYYDGSTWYYTDGGTTTLPTSADATYTIALPNDLRIGMVLNYTTQQMVMQGSFLLSTCFGTSMPDGFIIVVVNYTGAALSTGCIVDYTPLNMQIV
jgi:hypothetical protein